jgi:hypothetical protein
MVDPAHPSPSGPPDPGERTHFMPTRSGEGGEEEVEERRPPEPAPVIEHTWRNNPMLWVAVVVLVFLAVPLLVECSRNGRIERAAAKNAQSAASAAEPAAPELAQPTAAPSAEAQPPPAPGVVVTRPAGQPPRPAADGPRQMITKCIERGRVVYTQTGDCSGSVTAVPIDADKNVVGADRPAREGPGTKPP